MLNFLKFLRKVEALVSFLCNYSIVLGPGQIIKDVHAHEHEDVDSLNHHPAMKTGE